MTAKLNQSVSDSTAGVRPMEAAPWIGLGSDLSRLWHRTCRVSCRVWHQDLAQIAKLYQTRSSGPRTAWNDGTWAVHSCLQTAKCPIWTTTILASATTSHFWSYIGSKGSFASCGLRDEASIDQTCQHVPRLLDWIVHTVCQGHCHLVVSL